MNIDLHCHSNISDGMLSPAEVVTKARADGCNLLALTDHDHTGGLAAARAQANALGMTFVNGVEISVTWRGRTIHIVGLDFDEHDNGLQQLLAQVRQGRLARFRAIADKLAQKGIAGAYEGALAYAAHPEMASRTHLAQFLVDKGYVRHKAAAFKRYLGDGKCASVRHEWADLGDTVRAIRAADGIAVIAHPMRYGLSATAKRNLFTEFKELGGQAIEVHSGRASLNDRLNYASLAEQFQLLASVGSDFHRDGDFGGGRLGCCPALPAICQPVWHHFRLPEMPAV